MVKKMESQAESFLTDPRLPAVSIILAALALYILLPGQLTLGPSWILAALEGALVVILALTSQYRSKHAKSLRYLSILLIGLIGLANLFSVGLLVHLLLHGTMASGTQLFFSALEIWLTNVLVFALWFWEIDRGGPVERSKGSEHYPDFLFPQMTQTGICSPSWLPNLVDYLYLSLTNATAFSPTDTMPLSPIAKILMGIESLVSLLTVTIVAARAINILH
ncbi:MAG: hypothetical protein HKL83_08330 [Acidimicrobiaceae bacterium]|nr:hypothetical protein [Acidimicrobiaceae bacterium]